MSPIAGAISGIIAYGVDKNLDGAKGYHSWQWLFIIEGVATIFFALLIIILLPQLPDTVAKKGHLMFRSEDERRIISQRLRAGIRFCNLLYSSVAPSFSLKRQF